MTRAIDSDGGAPWPYKKVVHVLTMPMQE